MTTIKIEVPDRDAEDLEPVLTELVEVAAHAGAPGDLVEVLQSVVHAPGGLSAVRGLLESLAVREGVLRHVTDTVANQPLPVGPATAGQIGLVDQAWRKIESRYGALDAAQYAQLVGASPTTRSVASKAKAKGLVGYRRGRRILYPGFQFDERGLRSGWNDIVAPLREAGWDDEDIVLWLAAPHGALDRRSPVEALDDGDRSLVIGAVKDKAAGVW